jgi:microcystin-dependent protein
VSDQFVAEIRIFPFNFPPTGWAFCNGQLLPISQNTALFSLLGTFYGGDGKSTFALPNLQGAGPVHVGNNQPGPGLSEYFLGEQGGVDSVTLLQSEIPVHTHRVQAQAVDAGNVRIPAPTLNLAKSQSFTTTTAPISQLDVQAISLAGGGLPHNNVMPTLTLNFCIALQGIFPQRP